jgi:hypothetical protein
MCDSLRFLNTRVAYPPLGCVRDRPWPSASIRRFFRSRRCRPITAMSAIRRALLCPTLPSHPNLAQVSAISTHSKRFAVLRVSVPTWWVFLFCFSISRFPDFPITQLPGGDTPHPIPVLFSASPSPPRWVFLFCFSISRLPDYSIARPREGYPLPPIPVIPIWRRFHRYSCGTAALSCVLITRSADPRITRYIPSPCLRGACSCFAFADFFDWRLLSLVARSQQPGVASRILTVSSIHCN